MLWIWFSYCLKLYSLARGVLRVLVWYVFLASSRFPNCGSTGTSYPEPNSSNPTKTKTLNLLPTITKTKSQIPTIVLIQTLIPMVVHCGVLSYCCRTIIRASVWYDLATTTALMCICVCVYVCVV